MVQLNAETFHSRLNRLYKHWAENDSKLWKSVDAIDISVGRVDDNTPDYQKCTTIQTWLLNYEFTDTIMLFTEKKLYFLTSAKKAKILEELQNNPNNEDRTPIEILNKNNGTDEEYFNKLVEYIRQSKQGTKLGVIAKEFPAQAGTFIPEWLNKINAEKFEQIDITPALSDLISIKDDNELKCIKQAAIYTSKVLTKYLKPEMERIIEEEKQITHRKLAEQTEEVILDPSKNNELPKLPSDALDICFSPIIQSGGEYNLRTTTESDDRDLHFGTIVCELGAKYKSYCAIIARTYMIDASKEQEKNYDLLHEVFELILSKMKPKVKLCDLYNAAVDHIKEKKPKLVEHFLSSCGAGIGIEFKEQYLSINAKNQKTIKAGMVFGVVVGFENIPEPNNKNDPKRSKYSLLLADTVVVTDTKAVPVTKAPTKFEDVSYSLEEEEEPKKKSKIPIDINDANIIETRTRQKASEDKSAEDRRREMQKEIMRKKAEEYKAAAEKEEGPSAEKGKDASSMASALAGSLEVYKSIDEYPSGLKHNKIFVDFNKETVLLPINGIHTPFHISTIKNVSKSEQGEYLYLRINFHSPGHSFGQTYAPAVKYPNAAFIKEISYRSRDPRNLTQALRLILELRKKATQIETERKEKAGLVRQEPLKLQRGTGVPRLRDVHIRPIVKGKKTLGTLEAHINGLRFISTGGDQIDLLYANVRHAFYQEAKKSDAIVLLHFHLHNPIMVGKRQHKDIQFYTEVVQEYDQLVGRYRRNISDAESIEEEARERAMRDKLNKTFLDFATKVEEKSEQNDPENPLEFDIPYRELEFTGTPYRSSVTMVPTVHCLVSLTEPPFFVLSLDEVELAHFERVAYGLRNFDLVFIYKNYKRPVTHVNSIPVEKLDDIKDWLTQVGIKYFEGTVSLAWPKILKTIREDPAWDPWSEEHGWNMFLNLDNDEGSEDEDEEDDAYQTPSDESEYESEDDYDSDELEDEDESDEDSDYDEDEEEGQTWEELEREAREQDKEMRQRHEDYSDDEDEAPKREPRKPAARGGSSSAARGGRGGAAAPARAGAGVARGGASAAARGGRGGASAGGARPAGAGAGAGAARPSTAGGAKPAGAGTSGPTANGGGGAAAAARPPAKKRRDEA